MEDFPENFQSLEAEYIECKQEINKNINILSQQGDDKDAQHHAKQNAQANLVEAQRFVKLLSVEARGKPPAKRKAMQAKINVYRGEIQALQRDFERAMLMSRESSISAQTQKNRRDESFQNRMAQSTKNLKNASKQLDDSRRIVAETEEIGISVLDNLSQQRESLLSSHEKVKETNSMTLDAKGVLKRMSRRAVTNKIVLWGVIVMLSLSICAVIYFDFIKRKN